MNGGRQLDCQLDRLVVRDRSELQLRHGASSRAVGFEDEIVGDHHAHRKTRPDRDRRLDGRDHRWGVKLFAVLEEFTRKEGTISATVISLETKMEEIVRRIESMSELHFGGIREAGTRAEIIVTFLAILHLARDHALTLEQKSNFSDIIIRKPRKEQGKRNET